MSSVGALTFTPHFEERVWGGRNLADLGREIPDTVPVGESWEISPIAGRPSHVRRGVFKGQPFDALLESHGDEILGDVESPTAPFPLLLKLLDSAQPLSVQLHPNDREAVSLEGPGVGSVGKTEAWIVLEAEPGAEIIHGLAPGVAPDTLYDQLSRLRGNPLPAELERSLFRWVTVRRGDVIFVPAGTIHALGAGVVLAEVQQSSDITYRIYDWGRRDRQGRSRDLHVEKARGVRLVDDVRCPYARLDAGADRDGVTPLLACDKFRFDLVSLRPGACLRTSTVDTGRRDFHILFGWSGRVSYRGSDGDALEIAPSSFVLLPASLGAYELHATEGPASAIRIQAA